MLVFGGASEGFALRTFYSQSAGRDTEADARASENLTALGRPKPGTGAICLSRGRKPADNAFKFFLEPRSGGTPSRRWDAAAPRLLPFENGRYRGLTPTVNTNNARSGLS